LFYLEAQAKIDPEQLKEEKQKEADLRRRERERIRAERNKRSIEADTDAMKAMGIAGFGQQKYFKTTVRWDYAPDVCKDFKETGFCTFGGKR